MATLIDTDRYAKLSSAHPDPLPGPRIDPFGRLFPWGPIDAVHRLGSYTVVEYRRDNSRTTPVESALRDHGQVCFSVYLGEHGATRAYDTLEEALIGAIALRREGGNTRADRYFELMLHGHLIGQPAPQSAAQPAQSTGARSGVAVFGPYEIDHRHQGDTAAFDVYYAGRCVASHADLDRAMVAAVATRHGKPEVAGHFDLMTLGVLPGHELDTKASRDAYPALDWEPAPLPAKHSELDGVERVVVQLYDSFTSRVPTVMLPGRFVGAYLPAGRPADWTKGRVVLDEPLWGNDTLHFSLDLVVPVVDGVPVRTERDPFAW